MMPLQPSGREERRVWPHMLDAVEFGAARGKGDALCIFVIRYTSFA